MHSDSSIDLEEKQTLTEVQEPVSLPNSMHNANNSVTRDLPPEILAHIFSFLQPEIPNTIFFGYIGMDKEFGDEIYKWIYTSHVCVHWRMISFSTPSLWTTIYLGCGLEDNHSASFALLSLRQSKNSPLNLIIDGCQYIPLDPDDSESGEYDDDLAQSESEDQLPPDALIEIFNHTSRIQSLHLKSDWFGADASSLWALLQRPAPLLESLTIEMQYSEDRKINILPCLFDNNKPNLRNLHLSSVANWNSNQFNNLTKITITDQPTTLRPSLSDFLRFLSESLLLEKLILISAGPMSYDLDLVSTHFLNSLPVIQLNSLRYLEIGDTEPWEPQPRPGEHLRLFLSHISFPKTTTFCSWNSEPYISIRNHFSYLRSSSVPITRLVITSFRTSIRSGCLLGVGYDGDSNGTSSSSPTSTLYINGKYRHRQPTVLNFTDPYLQYSSFFQNIQELICQPHLYWNIESMEKQFLQALSDSTTITKLHIIKIIRSSGDSSLYYGRHLDTLRLLSDFTTIPGNTTKTTTPIQTLRTMKYLPHLNTIHIYSDSNAVATSGSKHWNDNTSPTEIQHNIMLKKEVDILVEIAKHRELVNGYRMKKLVIGGHGLESKDIVRLRGCFEEVYLVYPGDVNDSEVGVDGLGVTRDEILPKFWWSYDQHKAIWHDL